VARFDFVGQNEVGEDRAGLEAEGLGAAIVTLDDHAADDVGGHQVRRELNAGIFEMQNAAERSKQSGLARPGNSFEQNVAAARRQMSTPSTTCCWPTMIFPISCVPDQGSRWRSGVEVSVGTSLF